MATPRPMRTIRAAPPRRRNLELREAIYRAPRTWAPTARITDTATQRIAPPGLQASDLPQGQVAQYDFGDVEEIHAVEQGMEFQVVHLQEVAEGGGCDLLRRQAPDGAQQADEGDQENVGQPHQAGHGGRAEGLEVARSSALGRALGHQPSRTGRATRITMAVPKRAPRTPKGRMNFFCISMIVSIWADWICGFRSRMGRSISSTSTFRPQITVRTTPAVVRAPRAQPQLGAECSARRARSGSVNTPTIWSIRPGALGFGAWGCSPYREEVGVAHGDLLGVHGRGWVCPLSHQPGQWSEFAVGRRPGRAVGGDLRPGT